MTTKVTVDAHAGWPVKVVTVSFRETESEAINSTIVEPGTVRDFYIHSDLSIISIEELEGST